MTNNCPRCGRPQTFRAYCVKRDNETCDVWGSEILAPEKVTQ